MNSSGLARISQHAPKPPTVCTFKIPKPCSAALPWLLQIIISKKYIKNQTKRKSSQAKNPHRPERTTTAPFSEHISNSDNNRGFAVPLCAAFLPSSSPSCCIQQSYTTPQRGITDYDWTINGGK